MAAARCQAPTSMGLEFPLSDDILNHYLRDEEEQVQALLQGYTLEPGTRDRIRAYARDLLNTIRNAKPGLRVEVLLKEYGLDSKEGVALMCLAEALLRIPDPDTAEAFLRDCVNRGNWAEHLGHSPSRWVNASTWGLLLTGKLLHEDGAGAPALKSRLRKLVRRMGEPLALNAIRQTMPLIGQQFVAGETIAEAVQQARREADKGYYHSFDMLGEAALTLADVRRYRDAYASAIHDIATQFENRRDAGSLSIKLSALHPRFELRQTAALDALYDTLMELLLLAQEKDVAVTLDAEESWRLEPTLMLFARALGHRQLRQWGKLGIAMQTYQKRAPDVLQWLMNVSRSLHCLIPVRIVKGAYWDSEIKQAQQLGLEDYPVFTLKAHSDLCYLTCVRTLLENRHFLYPQFATHNAHTVASIITLAEEKNYRQFEFQRLHGMGEALYDHVLAVCEDVRCRVYAPVGSFQDLLPYLVRRLLENGANTSFVRQIQLAQSDGAWLIEEPTDAIIARERFRHPKIPLPRRLYHPERRNSRGLNLESTATLQQLARAMQPLLEQRWDLPAGQDDPERRRYVHSPAQPEDVVGSYLLANREDCLQAFAHARAAFPAWRLRDVDERAELLEATAQLFEQHYEELMMLAMREGGKTLPNALAEVREAVDFLRYYAQQARRLFEPVKLPGVTGEDNQLRLEGRGPVLCISPWNFPLAIFTGQVAAALVAGNTVLAKPATLTPLIAARAVALFHEAGVPREVLQLVTASAKTMEDSILQESGLRAVMFTGSTSAAAQINRRIALRNGPIIPLIAETGGQNAMIVDSTALVEQVTRDIVQSAFDSAGQRCSALRVLFVQEDIRERLLTTLTGYLDTLRLGDPLDWSTDIGPVIDANAQAELQLHIERFRQKGRVLYQGPMPEGPGHFVPPTIIALRELSELLDEVFGPVLHVLTFKAGQVDGVIDQINATGFGLTLGVHSRIQDFCERIARRAQVGNVYINRNMIGATVGSQPFGGQDLSGTGPKAGGPHYLLRLVNEKTISVNTAAIGGNTQLLSED